MFIQISGILNENEKFKTLGRQCWATLWPTASGLWPGPAAQWPGRLMPAGTAEREPDVVIAPAALWGCMVVREPDVVIAPAALRGCMVVRPARPDQWHKHHGMMGSVPSKLRQSGAHRSGGATTR
jgi:hypothetical protein